MDSPRQQRSISLCQPHSTTPHPSRAGVPTRLPDALGFRPSTAGGQGATLSTSLLVPLTREPTCTQAIDPGISRSTLTPADTSRPSRSSGHFPDFTWPGSPWLAHGSPLHGDWFPNPMGLLLGAFNLPALPMSHSPLLHPLNRPVPSVPWTPYPFGPLCGPSHTPFPALSSCPSIPCLYPTRSPATLWRWPTGASSFQAPFRAPSTGRSLPAPVPFACAAALASSPGLSCGPIPSLIPCLYPIGPPATPWRGPTGSSSIRGPFRAPSTGRSPPSPAPLSCAVSLAVLVTWGCGVALATRPFLSRLLVVLSAFVSPFLILFSAFCFFFFFFSWFPPPCMHAQHHCIAISFLFGAHVQSLRHPVALPLAVPGRAGRPSHSARVAVQVSALSPLYPPLPSVLCPPS